MQQEYSSRLYSEPWMCMYVSYNLLHVCVLYMQHHWILDSIGMSNGIIWIGNIANIWLTFWMTNLLRMLTLKLCQVNDGVFFFLHQSVGQIVFSKIKRVTSQHWISTPQVMFSDYLSFDNSNKLDNISKTLVISFLHIGGTGSTMGKMFAWSQVLQHTNNFTLIILSLIISRFH